MPNIVWDLTYIARCGALCRSQLLEPLGLNNQQAGSLIFICRHPGITQDGLARRVALSKSNISRHLAFLEERGLVTRVTPPTDKRVLQLHPTEKALALLPQIREVYQSWRTHLLQDLTEEEQTLLSQLLQKIKDRSAEKFEEERNA